MISLRRQPAAPGLAARDFVDSVLRPVALQTDTNGQIPDDVVTSMQRLGYFGLTIPEQFGGAGLGLVDYLEVVRELSRTNAAFQELTEENNGIGSAALLIAGSEQQKQRWLPGLASGATLGSFAVSEPNAGSDVAAIQTTARRVPGGYRLSGTKHFITHGAAAGLVTVVARLAPSESSKEFGLFLVTPEMEGFKVGRLQPMMGYRASGQAELVFDEVFVPDDAVLGNPGDGFRVTMKTLDRGRLTVSADCLGAAEELLDRTIAYARARKTFGYPLASRGEIRAMIAMSAIDLFCLESALFEFAGRSDAGEDIRSATARLKLVASEAASRVADWAMQIHGGLGYTTEAEIERYVRDLRVLRIAEGASEVMRIAIARGFHRDLDQPSRLSAPASLSAESDVATARLLQITDTMLVAQASADPDTRSLSEVRDARLGDLAARWTMIEAATRRLDAMVRSQGASSAASVAGIGVYAAARRLAGDAVEGALLATMTSSSAEPYREVLDELGTFDMKMGTTDRLIEQVAGSILGTATQ